MVDQGINLEGRHTVSTPTMYRSNNREVVTVGGMGIVRWGINADWE